MCILSSLVGEPDVVGNKAGGNCETTVVFNSLSSNLVTIVVGDINRAETDLKIWVDEKVCTLISKRPEV